MSFLNSPKRKILCFSLHKSGSQEAKDVVRQLATDAGFEVCYDFGGEDKVVLIEQLAMAWINLAIMQKEGRNIAFKILRR